MKNIFIYLTTTFLLISTSSFSQSWDWAERFGGSSYDEGTNISMDRNENIYIAGSFNDTILLGSTQLSSTGNGDMFFTKLDSNSNVLWALQYGGNGTDWGLEIISDSLGNCYLLGAFEDTLTIGTYTLISAGIKDMFMAKIDSNLNVIWAKRGGGIGNDTPFSIKLDKWGNEYVCLVFQANAYFDADSLTSTGGYDIALIKYDNNGNLIWANSAGGLGIDIPYSIDVDFSGSVYMGGNFEFTCNFSSNSVTSSGLRDVFIAKYDSAGNDLWVKSSGGIGSDANTMVRLGQQNEIYVAGLFRNTIQIGNTNLVSMGGADIFIAKYDTTGKVIWAKQAGSTFDETLFPAGMAVDKADNIYITGTYGDTITFGSITIPGNWDICVAKYDSSGNALWAKSAMGIGGVQSQNGWGVIASNNDVYITGSFQNDLSFDNSPLMLSATAGSDDIYVAKISQVPTGINDIVFTNRVAIYPNPSTTACTISAPNFNNATLILYDITGRELVQQKFNEQTAINVGQLNAGMYVVEIKDKEGRCLKGKVVKD